MRGLVAVAGVLAACGAAGVARADEVHLRAGGTIVGRLIDEGGPEIEVQQDLGAVKLRRSEVAWVKRGIAPRDEFPARLAAIDAEDPQALLALAAWAEEKGLPDKAREARVMARDLALERKIAALGPGEARAFLDLARAVEAEGGDRRVRRLLIERAVQAGGDGAEAARRALDAIDAEELAEREAKAERLRLEKERERLAAERKKLEAERRRLAIERALAEERAQEEAREREEEGYVIPLMYGGGPRSRGWKIWRYGPFGRSAGGYPPYYVCGSWENRAATPGHRSTRTIRFGRLVKSTCD
jgi:hypothetical protein